MEQTMNIKDCYSYMRYIFELGFRAHGNVTRLRHPAQEFVCFRLLATVTDAHGQATAVKATSRLLVAYPVIFRQLQTVCADIDLRAIRDGRDRDHHIPSEFVSSRLAATVVDTFRYSTPVTATSRQAPASAVTLRHSSPFFASIVLQLVRWCSGGIRLLAMQETGGQLLAKKQRSRTALLASTGGACA